MKSSLGNKEIMAGNIRRHLDRLGLNVKDFAVLMNFKYSTVLDWVNAKTYPRIDKIELMANYFNVEKSDLVEAYSSTPTTPTLDLLTQQINDTVVQLTTPNKKIVLRTSQELLEGQKKDKETYRQKNEVSEEVIDLYQVEVVSE
ncbi:helix-turn-helix domain-containing protein, partial [Streptococcus oralis]|uniref:helix-turn-helix domain-containing protein n=1 Tax=Streptococcus oralis TaxID=1303 RepID=UPI000A905853